VGGVRRKAREEKLTQPILRFSRMSVRLRINAENGISLQEFSEINYIAHAYDKLSEIAWF
jgi:hypothetical protein